jgi:hypothetical protein
MGGPLPLNLRTTSASRGSDALNLSQALSAGGAFSSIRRAASVCGRRRVEAWSVVTGNVSLTLSAASLEPAGILCCEKTLVVVANVCSVFTSAVLVHTL